MSIIESIVIAIIEGLTEFLPVSSTGHMILTKAALGITEDGGFVDTFIVSIQIGAILAIVGLYYKRFLQGITIYIKLMAAFIPTAIIGLLAYDVIKSYLFNPTVVALALIIGGVILILIDKKVVTKETQVVDLSRIPIKNAVFIGLFQCLSMVPGTSRAAATIVGGVFNKFNKTQATEFSFLLAVPTMIAATGYDLYKTPVSFTSYEILVLCIGVIVAFISAFIAVKIFIKLVAAYGFKHYGFYRIGIGIIFLLVSWVMGVDLGI
ncbi:undecaprenyl-diphosphate phosphatase [Mesohalobacter halotolerans]|uniref:Undecaprenyl-diphosphatase n=1 Tax=Mesohalobacter halotolerans TaxID=1883405 RepID=A0A4U5TR43_9FLAO|nr:undecaprenyl-diphosphate phosphatase [Mesohalobacter halotolerans]MBS3739122.1 undecaprenyl-diphosphate phosphatase [Psychroflexus sp.]TKS55858.1 undecaprenyl-diphosphate phosphatase [Mesohalobacter halotolerans]